MDAIQRRRRSIDEGGFLVQWCARGKLPVGVHGARSLSARLLNVRIR